MDTLGPLEALAKALPGLAREAVEDTLVSFDTLVHFGDQGARPEAARFLREAAAVAENPWHKERLQTAAEAVLAEKPLALTPDGKTWQQAAAAQTIGIKDWVEPPEPVYAEEPVEPEEPAEPEEEEDHEEFEPQARLGSQEEDDDDEDEDEDEDA